MAVLVRELGIPARIAVGYRAGTLQDDGTYLVQSTDAHAWVEVFFEGYGWLQFEPTPGHGTHPNARAWHVPEPGHHLRREGWGMRRIALLTFGLLVLSALPASAAPDVVRQGTCSDGARAQLELTDRGGMDFEPHLDPIIVIRRLLGISNVVVSFRGTRVASDSGDLAVQRRVVRGRAWCVGQGA